jgi:hypothetical protein
VEIVELQIVLQGRRQLSRIGDAMPGLAPLKAAQAGQVSIASRDVAAGAELEYRSGDPRMVAAR